MFPKTTPPNGRSVLIRNRIHVSVAVGVPLLLLVPVAVLVAVMHVPGKNNTRKRQRGRHVSAQQMNRFHMQPPILMSCFEHDERSEEADGNRE